MTKIVLFCLFFLASCKIVTGDEFRRVEAACKPHMGLAYFRADPLPWQSVARCEDGTEIARLPDRGKK